MKTSSTQQIKFVSKGWGFEKWIVNCKEYCGKLLYFVKGSMKFIPGHVYSMLFYQITRPNLILSGGHMTRQPPGPPGGAGGPKSQKSVSRALLRNDPFGPPSVPLGSAEDSVQHVLSLVHGGAPPRPVPRKVVQISPFWGPSHIGPQHLLFRLAASPCKPYSKVLCSDGASHRIPSVSGFLAVLAPNFV